MKTNHLLLTIALAASAFAPVARAGQVQYLGRGGIVVRETEPSAGLFDKWFAARAPSGVHCTETTGRQACSGTSCCYTVPNAAGNRDHAIVKTKLCKTECPMSAPAARKDCCKGQAKAG